jgi:cellulose 1,4-beta-cellobiosidase
MEGLVIKIDAILTHREWEIQVLWGPKLIINTGKRVTIIKKFFAKNRTDNGQLSEIRRKYVQGGRVIENTVVNILCIISSNSISDDFCNEQKSASGDISDFEKKGGLSELVKAFDYGIVLVLSHLDDHQVNIFWFDSIYSADKSINHPDVTRGPGSPLSWVFSDVESQHPDSLVTFSDIRFGSIDLT